MTDLQSYECPPTVFEWKDNEENGDQILHLKFTIDIKKI